MIEQITTLVEMLGLISLDHRVTLRAGDDMLFRLRDLRRAGEAGENDALLPVIFSRESPELARVFAAVSLQAASLRAEEISRLHDCVLNDPSVSLRTAVARQLRLATEPVVIDRLFDALLRCRDPQLRGVIAFSIYASSASDWRAKATRMLAALQSYQLYREHLDCQALLTAIRPSDEALRQNRFLLTDDLIGKAVSLTDDIERMTGVLAGLIIESVGHNLNRANQRVSEYEHAHADPPAVLTLLRSEMNSLLTPAERRARLEETFEGPLRAANEEIRHIWESSIRSIERAIRARRWSGGLGFVASALILMFAVALIGFKGDEGYWVALIGIVTLAISVIHSGPVRDHKQALVEIGAVNAAYTAYVQRTLEISNAYAHLYLQDKLTQKELKFSSQLISEAMNDTVNALRATKKVSIDDFLNQLTQ